MAKLSFEVSDSQMIEWITQLPAESKKRILLALIPQMNRIESLVDRGGERMREICARRGVDWESLSENERLQLVDEILHES